jgi:glycosyltransferase involved in cell wall biosynthesis
MGVAHVVVGVSEAVTQAMVARGLPAERVRTIHNGVVGSFRSSSVGDLERPTLQHPAIVTLGGVSSRKGADVLFAAFELLSDANPAAHLYYVGHLDWSEFVERVRSSRLAKRVHFVGFEPNPRRFLAEADVFAFPSRREALGLALLEAMEAGVPVAASAVDGIPEALDGGKCGILVQSEDHEALSQAIHRLLNDPALATELGRAAQARSRDLSVGLMSERYVELYRSLVRCS